MPISIHKTFSFTEHDAPVYGLEAFGDHSFFSGGGDRIVSYRDTKEDSVAKGIVNTGSTIYSLKYIPEKNILLTGVSGGGMHVIDLNKKKEIHFLLNHEKGIFDIKYSPKHDKILTAGGDGKISAWSGKDFSFYKTHTLCKEKIRTIAFDKDENMAAVGCGDGTAGLAEAVFNLKSSFNSSPFRISVLTENGSTSNCHLATRILIGPTGKFAIFNWPSLIFRQYS